LSDNVFRWSADDRPERPRDRRRAREPVRETPREVTLQDLGQLSLRAAVAFAARCARRVQPRFSPPAEFPHRGQAFEVVEAAIRLAEEYAAATAGDFRTAPTSAQLAFNLGEATYPYQQLAPYAAYHAARAVSKAFPAGERASPEVATEVLAAAYGASRVVVAGGTGTLLDGATRRLVHEALLADFEVLLRVAAGGFGDMGDPIDPSEAGPLGALWPDGPPGW
jgi:hypothetical protein